MVSRFTLRICLVILSGLFAASSSFAERPWSALTTQDAALVIDGAVQSAALQHGGAVRCQEGQRVGVWVSGEQGPVAVEGLRVEGCEVGVVVEGAAPSVATSEAQRTPSQAAQSLLAHVEVSECQLGYYIKGSGFRIWRDTISNCDYGIVVEGHDLIIEENLAENIRYDGILVLSSGNQILKNRVEGFGRYGINVVANIPYIDRNVVLKQFQNVASFNVITDNVVVGTGTYGLRQWPFKCYSKNRWERNIAARRSASCLK